METISSLFIRERASLYKWASALALITIFYNILEGAVSVFFGLEDETIALFGFGLDSFVEVISGIGIWHMVKRLRKHNISVSDRFEKQALRVTGTAFFVLAGGLAAVAALQFIQKHRPETTFWGVVVSVVSIISMWALIHYKIKVGRKLNSKAIIADANCTRACMYLSFALLASSIGYELTGIGGIDSLGAVFIAGLSVKEGREAFRKAKGGMACGCKGSCH